jgi:hypothetical protein
MSNGIIPEEIAGKGLTFIRKTYEDKPLYFVANVGDQFRADWITVGAGSSFKKYDPMTDEETLLPTREHNGKTEMYLSLLPGQSCFLKSASTSAGEVIAKVPTTTLPVSGVRDVTFLKGMPSLPPPTSISDLNSWTTFSEPAIYFSGKARYTLTFNVPKNIATRKELLLDLGDVREVADVKINGKSIGTAWSIPYRLGIPAGALQIGKNLLEVEVSNLSANYMRLRDTQAPEWKKFYDANIVDITYKNSTLPVGNPCLLDCWDQCV